MNDFIVSALKYRPKNFEDVIGQKHITDTLSNSIIQDKIPSAILFCGPRGVGKTSCARIYAKEINKSSIDDIESHDLSFNIFELDAASNRGIDEMKNLIDKVRVPPQIGSYKVYIIDEVHMLTTQAMNAFLKTLEEPPKHIIFVLATTEKNKILPTILSRCQIYDFNRINDNDIYEKLISVCEKEGFMYENDAISIIAKKSDGSLRDSLTILDRVVSFTNKNISTEKTSKILNILDNESFLKLSKNIIHKRLVPVLLQFNEISEKGYNEKDFLTGLANHFRNILISKSKESHVIFDFSSELLDAFVSQGELIDNNEIIDKITIVENSIFKYNTVENKKLLVEITLMKICKNSSAIQTDKKPEDQKKKVDLNISNELSAKKNDSSSTNKLIKKSINSNILENSKDIIEKDVSALSLSSLKLKKDIKAKSEKDRENKKVDNQIFDLDKLKIKWIKYSKKISENGNNSLSSILEISEPIIINENKIIYTVPSNGNKREINLEREKILNFLREELKNDSIELEILVDKTTSKEYYSTPSEKFDKLTKMNPLLKKFKDDLKLDL